MSCGFGAVVLIFLIINHATERDTEVINDDLLSEIRMLDYQVQNGERDLVELLESLNQTEMQDKDQVSAILTKSAARDLTIMELQKKQLEFFPKTFNLTMKPLMYTSIPIILLYSSQSPHELSAA